MNLSIMKGRMKMFDIFKIPECEDRETMAEETF